jgi:hypothetical protein
MSCRAKNNIHIHMEAKQKILQNNNFVAAPHHSASSDSTRIMIIILEKHWL